ncbi:MAG: hypothetical protein IE890_07700 [Arcobacter sp.]|jgi:hypothetical protein|nr:hypothetical protein [Arcobacter sp.]
MLNFLKRRLKNQKGAMDKILVTLLLVIVGVGAVVGLSQWANDQKNAVQNSANTAITNVTTPATTNAQ